MREIGEGPAQLPVRLTSFIARERETAQVRSLLATHRVVVLTGAGGCGKTRLATHVARVSSDVFPDGAVWVDLSGVLPAADVTVPLAEAVGVADRFGGSLLDAVTARLRSSTRLVLLDNCEHVAPAVATVVAELLTGCANVAVLATSRTPLGVEGEVLFRVPSLDCSGDERSEAARLFVDRAALARHDFASRPGAAATIASICRRLDGMPLAIELAAARVRMHDLEEIESSLRGRFEVLAAPRTGVVQRHRTIDASVAWSYGLLAERERALLARLSVFRGSFTLAGAQAVVADASFPADDVLPSLSLLVDHSLVEADIDAGGTRYRLLETIRTFAADRMDEAPADSDVVAERHVLFHRRLVEEADGLMAAGEPLAAIDLLAPEERNLLAALERAEAAGDVVSVVSIASSLSWDLRGRSGEPMRALRGVAEDERHPVDQRIEAAVAAAGFASSRWDLALSEALAGISLDLARVEGDERALAASLTILGVAALWTGRRDDARQMLEEARGRAEATGDVAILAMATVALGQFPFALGDMGRARDLFETAADLARRCGRLRIVYEADAYLVLLYWFVGDDGRLAAAGREGLAIARACGLASGESMFLSFHAAAQLRHGRVSEAAALLDRAGALADVSGHPLASAHLATQRAFLSLASGDLEASLDAHGACAALARAMNITLAGILHTSVAADIASALALGERAHQCLDAASAWEQEIGSRFAMVAVARSAVAYDAGDLEAAVECAHDAIALGLETDAELAVLEGLELLAAAWLDRARTDDAARLIGAVDTVRSDRSWVAWPTTAARLAGARSAVLQASPSLYDEGRAMSLRAAASYAQRGRGGRRRPATGWGSLTPSEMRVAELVADGLSNADIAAKLFVTVATVKTHLTHIYAKTGTTSRVQLAKTFAGRGP